MTNIAHIDISFDTPATDEQMEIVFNVIGLNGFGRYDEDWTCLYGSGRFGDWPITGIRVINPDAAQAALAAVSAAFAA